MRRCLSRAALRGVSGEGFSGLDLVRVLAPLETYLAASGLVQCDWFDVEDLSRAGSS